MMSGAGCATNDRCDPAALSLLITWTVACTKYNLDRTGKKTEM